MLTPPEKTEVVVLPSGVLDYIDAHEDEIVDKMARHFAGA